MFRDKGVRRRHPVLLNALLHFDDCVEQHKSKRNEYRHFIVDHWDK